MMTTASRSDRNVMLEGARALAARDLRVISLRSRSKIPLHAGWPELGTTDPITLELEWSLTPDANVGVLCGHGSLGGRGVTVLDVDHPDGTGTLLTLEQQHETELPVAPMVLTPSNGFHHYFAGVTASWNPGPGLEVRSIGRQCAAPPSIHPNGGRYEWAPGCPDTFPDLPVWLVKRDQPRRPRCDTATAGLRDPVLEVPPPVYFQELAGVVANADGYAICPFHVEQTASLRIYPTAAAGWFCYGESCQRGGDVITLAALLAGIPTPVVGFEFIRLLAYLRGRLL